MQKTTQQRIWQLGGESACAAISFFLFCVRVLSGLSCLFACTASRTHKEKWDVSEALFISHQWAASQTRDRRGGARRRRGRWDMGAPQGVGVQTWGHIKSIQLKQELQGSLNISKPMKVTIHQKRVPWCCCKATCRYARTQHSDINEKLAYGVYTMSNFL